MSSRPVTFPLAALSVLLLAAGTAEARMPGLERAGRSLGSGASYLVQPVGSSRVVAAGRPTRRRPLASLTKLHTAAAVLDLAPVARTEVRGTLLPDGSVTDLFLVGGGDPSLSSADVARLGGRLVAAGVRHVPGSVVGDESRFDTVRGGPSTGGRFDPELEGPLSALAVDRGRSIEGGVVSDDPARVAAARLDDALEARGVVPAGVPRSGPAPAGLPGLAALERPGRSFVSSMLRRSDDWTAEILGKLLADGTTAGAARLLTARARRRGQRATRLVDASGLDAGSRGTARDVVRLLGHRALRGHLVRPGTGTLAGRLRGGRARRGCRLKTGTLSGATNAAGVCRVRGRSYRFAVLAPGGRAADVDRFVQALARGR